MTNAEKFKTTEERLKAFGKWHEEYCGMRGVCAKDDVCAHTVFHWLDLEAEEEKPLPCPLCGEECEVVGRVVRCRSRDCGYEYYDKRHKYIDETIAAHNRVSHAVGAGQKEVTP